MATVKFYAKPGCLGNARQMELLRKAGHEVIECNILAEPWDAEGLLRFFGNLPMEEWFNTSAKAVKMGLVVPERLTESQALRLLAADPMLIHRPLLQVGERFEVGFDPVLIEKWIGLDAQGASQKELETCPKPQTVPCT